MIPTECPRCESKQGFVPKLRENNEHGWQEEYIRCSVCRFEQILRYTTPEIETLRAKWKRLRDRIERQVQRHGQPSNTMVNLEVATQRDLSTMETELYARVREVNERPRDTAANANPA